MTSHFNPNPGPLDQLTAAQQHQLLAWLELHPTREVVRLVALEPPDGFGIKTHITTLERFYSRHKTAARRENLQFANEVLANSSQCGAFDHATVATLRHVAFELANSPRVTAKNFKAIARWTLKLRDQEQKAHALALEKERLALEREKLELNTARMALKRAGELQEILRKKDFDDEDKIRAARDRLFPRASDDPRNNGTENG